MNRQQSWEICRKCKHFRQHYVYYDRGYHWAYAGHCVYPRLKVRKPDEKACEHFEKCSQAGATDDKTQWL